MARNKLSIVIPQWQGGGQDLRTYYSAYTLRDNYLSGELVLTTKVSTDDISDLKNNILGYDDILASMKNVNDVLEAEDPDRIFTIGGGCDADTPCAAYMNRKYKGDMAIVYIDAHGDLNTPELSESKYYYGMSLRALAGDSANEIVDNLASTVTHDQLIMCANRNLDPEENRFKADNEVSDFTVDDLEADPKIVSKEITCKGFSNVYIHIDLDSLDPEEFQMTPVPEPNGIRCETLVSIIRSIRDSHNVVGFGILEYCGGVSDADNELIKALVEFGREI